MTNWFVGQRVVCVDDSLRHFNGEKWVVKDAIYTIREIGFHYRDRSPGFRLVEIVNPPRMYRNGGFGELYFMSHRFRPVVSPHAGISVFTSILDRINKREVVEA